MVSDIYVTDRTSLVVVCGRFFLLTCSLARTTRTLFGNGSRQRTWSRSIIPNSPRERARELIAPRQERVLADRASDETTDVLFDRCSAAKSLFTPQLVFEFVKSESAECRAQRYLTDTRRRARVHARHLSVCGLNNNYNGR